jgi:cytochrome c5
MIKAIVRNRTAARLVIAVLFMLFASAPSFGQTQGMNVEIPFQFILGSQTLPAGTYSFSVDNFGLVLQSDSEGKLHAMIITRLTGPSGFLQEGSLVFDKASAGSILSEVWIPGSDGILLHSIPKGHRRGVLSFSGLSDTGSVSGKTAFGLTCARCHGQKGEGNQEADKYFHTKIPRLNSPEVQSKSDAELRKIISNGTQTMPPVEVDEAGFRHRLPPQDVDAVIAYVRTLKE